MNQFQPDPLYAKGHYDAHDYNIVPDRYIPVVGWRGWNVDENGYLNSLAWPYVWYPTVQTAKCFNYHKEPGHLTPSLQCRCGLYGLNDLDMLHGAVGGCHLIGRVALWGKVVVGTMGHRAEFAYPQALFITRFMPNYMGIVAKLEQYRVPILHASAIQNQAALWYY
ncbi:MAG TPA: hypothetical protein VFK94_06550 [Patescibacteria group bacterium]|nr:hypothetical protein [Patescibacteria group bacterium]